ncbi:MAG: flagellar export protein FliJ [Thermoanaerobacteraceae bacterium]|nr:flagellar export protein FliJ [Thermoanaerobacteraceae bacterium]
MFRFRLQKVLDYKQSIEEEKKLELGYAYRLRQQEAARLKRYQQQKERALVSSRTGKLDLVSLRQRQQYLDVMDKKIASQVERLEAAEKRVSEKQVELRQAMQERKAFDRLKERQKQQFAYEFNRQQQKLLDEVATASFVRRESL